LGGASLATADETFSGAGGSLVDHDGSENGVAAFTINVNGFPGAQVAQLKSVSFTNLTHTFLGDLVIALVPPDGVASFVTVTSPPALESSNLNGNYTFVVDNVVPFQFQTLDEAAAPLGDNDTVPSGTLAASDWGDGELGPRVAWQEMEGTTLDGDWVIQFHDFFPGDTGALGSWSFTVTVPEPGVGLLSIAGGLALLLRRGAQPRPRS
jgi:hypothetical protein